MFLFLLAFGIAESITPVEVVLEHYTYTLHHVRLAERIFVHRMGVTLYAQHAVRGNDIFDIQIAEHGTVVQVVVAVAHVAVDQQSVDRLDRDLCLILLLRIGALAIGSEIDTERNDVRQFAQP